MLAVSWVAAVMASIGYGIGSVLQSVGARRTSQVAGLSGVALILVQAPYLLGLGLDVVAFLSNVVALQQLPLFLVQAILTASVGVTAVVAAIRGTRLTWRDWTSLAVLGLGLVLLSVSANSDTAVAVSDFARYEILASLIVPTVTGLVGLRLGGRASSKVLACASGLAYSGVAVASRGLSGAALGWSMLGDPLVWAIVLQGGIGIVFFALALQRGAVTSVMAITFMVEMVVPSIIGLLLFGDSVAAGLAAWAVLGFVLSVAGTISLMRFAE
ncbi:MAG: hypothetical protein QOF35_1322 [Actinomycetota bacterium]|jgi:hypothetical protein|nr:hypothetical protein [Actinomycetota bacterium]